MPCNETPRRVGAENAGPENAVELEFNEFHIYASVTDTSSTCGALVR